jgi:hypothetical protein
MSILLLHLKSKSADPLFFVGKKNTYHYSVLEFENNTRPNRLMTAVEMVATRIVYSVITDHS